jgi:hypothetical protein
MKWGDHETCLWGSEVFINCLVGWDGYCGSCFARLRRSSLFFSNHSLIASSFVFGLCSWSFYLSKLCFT